MKVHITSKYCTTVFVYRC